MNWNIDENEENSNHRVSLTYREDPPKSQFSRSTRRNQFRSLDEIPEKFRFLFDGYDSFNAVQSKCFDDVLHSKKHLVVSAPTGSGKTVIFELAIIRALQEATPNLKIIYVAPIKALCKERFFDWSQKFHSIGVKCKEATGDQDYSDVKELNAYQIILTTPEKWDSLTRKWRDNKNFVDGIKLFLVDEIHLLNEQKRGPTLEAVISRMKTISNTSKIEIRFIAVSATIPNIEDLAVWLGSGDMENVRYFAMPDDMRPVKLRKIVLGYNCDSNCTYFRFDMNLNYHLVDIINQHSGGKPTLIFCSTRKGVEIAAEVLTRDISISFTEEQQAAVTEVAGQILEKKLKMLVLKGIAYHHAGLPSTDRALVESAFREGKLPILVSTSTLAMGINLPAHLVIIKSTQAYNPLGGNEELSESAVLQMIGRAGRPQFDTSGVAVIMTQENKKVQYEKLVCGTRPVESHLHKSLAEHLNSEIVLQTIDDLSVAMQWIRSTFLYVRAHKNPHIYGFQQGSKEKIEKRLEDMCKIAINALEHNKLIVRNTKITATDYGRLMARYYVCFGTMKQFRKLNGTEDFQDILKAVADSEEFVDFKLRTNEKRLLNDLNRAKKRECVRFPIKGKIKSVPDKVSCLIQAVLGNLNISDQSLQQEATRIVQLANRLSKCLCEFLIIAEKEANAGFFSAIHKTWVLSKSLEARLWDNSPYVSKQFRKIGPQLSSTLVKGGVNTIRAICCTDPREMEKMLKKPPPFGNELVQEARRFPTYDVDLIFDEDNSTMEVIVGQRNSDSEKSWRNKVVLIVGNDSNDIMLYRNEISFQTRESEEIFQKTLQVADSVETIWCHLIHKTLVGVDKSFNLTINDSKDTQKSKGKKKPKVKKPATAKAKKSGKPDLKVTDFFPVESSSGPSNEDPKEYSDDDDFVQLDSRYTVTEILEPKLNDLEDAELSIVDVFESDEKPNFTFKKPTRKIEAVAGTSHQYIEPEIEAVAGHSRENSTTNKKTKPDEDLDENFQIFTNVSVLEELELEAQADLFDDFLTEEDIFMEIDRKIEEALNDKSEAQQVDEKPKCRKVVSSPIIIEEESPQSTQSMEPIVPAIQEFRTPLLPPNDFRSAKSALEEDIQRINPDLDSSTIHKNLFEPRLNSTEVFDASKKAFDMTVISSIKDQSMMMKTPVDNRKKISFLNQFFKDDYVAQKENQQAVVNVEEWISQNRETMTTQSQVKTIPLAEASFKRKADFSFDSILKKFCDEPQKFGTRKPDESFLWNNVNKVTQTQSFIEQKTPTKFFKNNFNSDEVQPSKSFAQNDTYNALLKSPTPQRNDVEDDDECQDINDFTQKILSNSFESEPSKEELFAEPSRKLGTRPGPYKFISQPILPKPISAIRPSFVAPPPGDPFKRKQQSYFTKSNAPLRYLDALTERYRVRPGGPVRNFTHPQPIRFRPPPQMQQQELTFVGNESFSGQPIDGSQFMNFRQPNITNQGWIRNPGFHIQPENTFGFYTQPYPPQMMNGSMGWPGQQFDFFDPRPRNTDQDYFNF